MAADPVALGIDLGASGARAIVLRASGEVLGSSRSVCSHLRHGEAGSEHDPRTWLEEACDAARDAVERAGVTTVDAIGVAALGPAPVVLDDQMRPLAPSPLFPSDPVPDWVASRPDDLLARASCVVDLTGFIVGTLIGHPVMDRVTAADHARDDLVVPTPPALEPLEVAGTLTVTSAGRLGLEPGAPVACGTYDTFIDLAAIGATDLGAATILLGSTVVVGVVRGDPQAPAGLRASPHVGPGWFVGGWTSTAGRALTWAADLFADDRVSVVRETAAMAPGAGGVLALPHLDGERAPLWDAGARGALLGLTIETSPADIYRGVLDGVVLSTVDLTERLAPIRSAGAWVVAGGGVREAPWLRSTTDAIGETIEVVDLPDAAAAARAGLAAIAGVGHLAPPPRRTVEPDPSMRERWDHLREVYRGASVELADRMHRLGRLARSGAGR